MATGLVRDGILASSLLVIQYGIQNIEHHGTGVEVFVKILLLPHQITAICIEYHLLALSCVV